MKDLKTALRELEEIVDNEMSNYNFPVVKGNSIRIGSLIIRNSKRFGYVIVDIATSKTVGNAHSKYGAVALANAHIRDTSTINIRRYDNIINKNTNDSYFYVNSIIRSTDKFRQDILSSRLEIAQQNIQSAKESLDSYILSRFR